MKSSYVDRSRVIGFQECGRRRFLEYHESGIGIVPIKKALPLAVGGAVHAGLEVILRSLVGAPYDADSWERSTEQLRLLEDLGVKAALLEFSQYTQFGLEVDANEQAQMKVSDNIGMELAKSLGLAPDHPDVLKLAATASEGIEKFDRYLVDEQNALVEALVRAYCRRRLRPLIEQFEVLEVEREGTWTLAQWSDGTDPVNGANPRQIIFMSRPDALLRDRESNQLVILSFKTASGWDIRRARDAEHDMQGLSEGVEVEQRLGRWWEAVQAHPEWDIFRIGYATVDSPVAKLEELHPAMVRFLKQSGAKPRIYAIRYEFMLKGDRKTNDQLGQELGVQARAQNSHLVRPYCNPGMTPGDAQWAWSYRFKKEDGSGSNLYYKNWKPAPVWRAMSIRTWIDQLDAATQTYSTEAVAEGLEPRLLGYQCLGGQATGYTDVHPLDDVFISPITVFRNDDDLRDWIDQTACQEERVVEGLVQIRETKDLSEVRHLLNKYFPMNRGSCEYPSTCSFVKVCYANNEDVKMRPMESGNFRLRTPNHPTELSVEK